MEIKDIVAIWGGALSTILAIVKGWELWRNTLRVQISAGIALGTDDDYGTPVPARHGGEHFAYVGISIQNKGEKPLQAFRIVVHTARGVHQITSAALPAIIQPGCRVETRIQKEWLDDPEATAIGVLTGTGKEELLTQHAFSILAEQSRSLPSERRQYRRKDDPKGELVWAWKVKDSAGLTTRIE